MGLEDAVSDRREFRGERIWEPVREDERDPSGPETGALE